MTTAAGRARLRPPPLPPPLILACSPVRLPSSCPPENESSAKVRKMPSGTVVSHNRQARTQSHVVLSLNLIEHPQFSHTLLCPQLFSSSLGVILTQDHVLIPTPPLLHISPALAFYIYSWVAPIAALSRSAESAVDLVIPSYTVSLA